MKHTFHAYGYLSFLVTISTQQYTCVPLHITVVTHKGCYTSMVCEYIQLLLVRMSTTADSVLFLLLHHVPCDISLVSHTCTLDSAPNATMELGLRAVTYNARYQLGFHKPISHWLSQVPQFSGGITVAFCCMKTIEQRPLQRSKPSCLTVNCPQ